MVDTRIMEGERNRPPALRDERAAGEPSPEALAAWEAQRQALAAGMSPAEVADRVLAAIAERRFYILTHPELMPLIEARLSAIVRGQNPPDPRQSD